MPAAAEKPRPGRTAPGLICEPVADAMVHIQAAHTSLERLAHVGVIARERSFFEHLGPLIAKQVLLVTYGGSADAEIAASLRPSAWGEAGPAFECISNQTSEEPARHQAGIPRRVLDALRAAGCRSALVYKDQHDGGEVAVQTVATLRAAGIRAGLVARAGYHWSWTVARDTAPNDPRAAAAALLEGELCRAADIVAVSTARISLNIAWQHRIDPARLRVLPNFIDAPAQVPAFAERTPGRTLFAGRLSPEKRVALLIRAVCEVSRRCHGAHLVVIGDGAEETALRALAREIGAPVEFRPRLSHADLLAEMGRCSVYAQVSRFEGHPKTILEAMAMGAPVVVTRAPGVDDEINPGVTGVICGNGAGDIAGAIAGVLRDPAFAEGLGAAAAADIRARLSPDTVFPRFEAAFRDAMRAAGAHATAPPSPVRWDQTLLNAGPDGAALEFASSIGAYARRLDDARREMFVDALAARIGSLRDPKSSAPPPAITSPGSPVSRR